MVRKNIIGGQDIIKGGQENILNGQSHSPKTSSAILTSKDHPSGIQLRGKFLESFTAKISPYISCKLGQQNSYGEKRCGENDVGKNDAGKKDVGKNRSSCYFQC